MTCACSEFPDIKWVIELARKAGAIIRKDFYAPRSNIGFKLSTADLVTETDTFVEKYLVDTIQERYPNHRFLCEESSKQGVITDDPTWVIDPVDGTMNFVHTVPFVAVSIGFMCHSRVHLGVVYNPLMDELFYATRGGGSWLLPGRCYDDPSPLRLSTTPPKALAQVLVATGFSASLLRKGAENELDSTLKKHVDEMKGVVFSNTEQLLLNCRDIRRTGSCACDMAFVASGRFDAMAELSVKEWDVCAGVLLIEEAGGTVMNYDKTAPADIGRRNIIGACSRETAEHLASILKSPSFDLRIYG